MNSSNELVVKYEVGDIEIKLSPSIVKEYIIGDKNSQLTMQEFKFFTELCKARGLNPFLKEVYCIKYENKPAQIVVGKDVVIKKAVLHPKYDGMESGVIVLGQKGEVIERQGGFYLPSEKLVGAWAKVYRKDWTHPAYVSAPLSEMAQRKGSGEMNSQWASKTAMMAEKVVKVRALRDTFVEMFAGMYEAEEFGETIPNTVPAQPVQQDNINESTAEEIETVDLSKL